MKLNEVKKGQEGYGLLIENDGYISRDVSENNKKIIKEAIDTRENTGEWNVPNPFILDVVLQKHSTLNANGRIYPEDILKREVAKYQELINDRRALGECYTPDAECLTPNGWVSIKDIKEGDEVITWNTKSEFGIEVQKVTYKTETPWNDKLIHVTTNNNVNNFPHVFNMFGARYGIDDVLTPNHSYPLVKWMKTENCDCEQPFFNKFMTIQEIMEGKKNNTLDAFTWIPLGEIGTRWAYDNIYELEFEEVDYNGYVYCIEVPNHTWYVRQNGKCHWTKNCNHPESSTIDLGRISHNIIECHWEGKTLMGKIEFNLTEGFRKHGICSSLGDTCANLILNGYKIGVSSRAVGSVKTQFGKTVVCDDLELICWDVVATPSTPGSYIGNREDLQMYIENDESKGHKDTLNEKIDKIKKLLQ